MDERALVEVLLTRWQGVRALTYDVLAMLGEAELVLRLPFPESMTLGSQFRCMLGAQESYTRALVQGRWQGFSCSLDALEEVTPSVITEQMRRADAALDEGARAAASGTQPSTARSADQLVQRIVEHEIVHHGQIINFLFCHHLPVPESWQDEWALPAPEHGRHLVTIQSFSDTERLVAFVSNLSLDFGPPPPEFAYENPVLILADATLSINRKYDAFVVPRIDLLRRQGPQTLRQLADLIDDVGLDGFSEIWTYRHPQRVELLRNLTQKFLQLSEEYGLEDMATLRRWATKAYAENWASFRVPGIGFTTYQYLRLLCGAETVKPDRHIQRAIEDGVGKPLPLVTVVSIVEQAASHLGVSARQLDYALWRHYSQQGTAK